MSSPNKAADLYRDINLTYCPDSLDYSIKFTLTKNNSEPFFERLQSMRINFEDMKFYEDWGHVAVRALWCIRSLDQVTVIFQSTSSDLSKSLHRFKQYIENTVFPIKVRVHSEVRKKELCWVADITRNLETSTCRLVASDPERSFRTFLEWCPLNLEFN